MGEDSRKRLYEEKLDNEFNSYPYREYMGLLNFRLHNSVFVPCASDSRIRLHLCFLFEALCIASDFVTFFSLLKYGGYTRKA